MRLRRTALTISTLLIAASMATGCMRSLEDEYREAVPTSGELAVDVPGASEGSAGAATEALIGERAPFYQMTRDTSRIVNGGIWITLQLVELIVRQRPGEVDGDHAVWGPWNEALSPISYVFVVERQGEGQFRYALQGKPRAEGDDSYVDLLAGETTIDATDGTRSGFIALDFTAAHGLDAFEHRASGRIVAHWEVGSDPRVVEAAFEGFTNARGEGPLDALYRYTEASDGSGSFELGLRADIDDPGPAA